MGDAAYAQPVSDYISAEQAEREGWALFRASPLRIALSCELPRPGDYVTDDFSGVNAFINVCRHRGAGP